MKNVNNKKQPIKTSVLDKVVLFLLLQYTIFLFVKTIINNINL